MRHRAVTRVWTGEKETLESSQGPWIYITWETVVSAKHLSQPVRPAVSRVTLFSSCDSECLSTTHAVHHLESHCPRAFPASY
jgi:hypothetical protein